MANPYEMFGTDESSEKSGVWVKFGDGLEIKLARAGGRNKRFAKTLEKKARPHRRAMQTNTVGEGVAEKLMIETYAKTVVMDWRNIEGPDGEPYPFSVENCIKLFTDLPDLFKVIVEEADAMENFQQAQLEEDSKN